MLLAYQKMDGATHRLVILFSDNLGMLKGLLLMRILSRVSGSSATIPTIMKSTPLLAMGASLLLTLSPSAHGQTLIGNIFEGPNTGPETLTASSLLVFGDTESGPIGPGWNGTVTLPAGLAYSLTMGINQGGNGQFNVFGSGVAGVAGTFSATKTFSSGELGVPFVAGELYALELEVASGAIVELLGSYNVALTIGGTGVNNASGEGLLGVADVLGLFGGTETAVLLFRAPDAISAQDLTVNISGGNLANIGAGGLSIGRGTVYAVPEPSGLALLSLGGLLFASRRRK